MTIKNNRGGPAPLNKMKGRITSPKEKTFDVVANPADSNAAQRFVMTDIDDVEIAIYYNKVRDTFRTELYLPKCYSGLRFQPHSYVPSLSGYLGKDVYKLKQISPNKKEGFVVNEDGPTNIPTPFFSLEDKKGHSLYRTMVPAFRLGNNRKDIYLVVEPRLLNWTKTKDKKISGSPGLDNKEKKLLAGLLLFTGHEKEEVMKFSDRADSTIRRFTSELETDGIMKFVTNTISDKKFDKSFMQRVHEFNPDITKKLEKGLSRKIRNFFWIAETFSDIEYDVSDKGVKVTINPQQ